MPRRRHSWVLPMITAALAGGIFVFDTLTDLEIAVAVLYVAVVLMSVGFCGRRGVVIVAATCMALTLLSFELTPTGSPESGLINGMISLAAIAATTYLALKIESAEVSAHEARAQLAHIARVTTLGELTASIAHEVNQPLSAVVTSGEACLRWLSNQPPNTEKARQAVDRIVTNANRASEVIQRVRGMVKQAPPQVDWFSINETISETISLTQNEIEKQHILLITELDDDLPPIVGDRIQLQQVILNLIVNSIEAIGSTADGPRELKIKTLNSQAKGVHLTVSDTGQGLPAGVSQEIFNAFYTTKPRGMGMGLAVSRSIVEAHGGSISARPNEPRGAIFQITLQIGGVQIENTARDRR
jgi:signal transduction histidine kinase